MANISKEVLAEALNSLEGLEALKLELEGYKKDADEAEAELAKVQADAEAEKDAAYNEGCAAATAEIDADLKAAEDELKEIGQRKMQAREAAVAARIEAETAELKASNEQLAADVKNTAELAGLPKYATDATFLKVFAPADKKDKIVAGVIALVVFLLVPYLIYGGFTQAGFGQFISVVLWMLLAGCGCFYLYSRTTGKAPEAVKAIRAALAAIATNKKSIATVTADIRKDPDDSQYGLEMFDDELAAKNTVIDELVAQKAAAVEAFDGEFAATAAEIAAKFADALAELEAAAVTKNNLVSEFIAKVGAKETEIADLYGETIGSDDLTVDGVKGLLAALEAEEATAEAETEE